MINFQPIKLYNIRKQKTTSARISQKHQNILQGTTSRYQEQSPPNPNPSLFESIKNKPKCRGAYLTLPTTEPRKLEENKRAS